MQEEINIIQSYLTFSIGKEQFAANVANVLNILEMVPITEVPRAPSYMKGVINLRGNVLPIIDTRIKFNMKVTEITKETCILVLTVVIDSESVQIGAIVDTVSEVIEYELIKIKPAPSIGNKYKSEFIDGIIEKEGNFIMILNLDKVFSIDEIITIQENINNSTEIENLQ